MNQEEEEIFASLTGLQCWKKKELRFVPRVVGAEMLLIDVGPLGGSVGRGSATSSVLHVNALSSRGTSRFSKVNN